MLEAASAQEAPELKIQLLGGFRVWVAARSIPATAWRPKTGRLLKLLALAPGHRLHREQVLDALWPDLDVAAGSNNVHRTLHGARRALQPDLARGAPSAFLHLREDTLALSAPGSLWIDVEAFELAAATARHTHEPVAYQTALELYAGELLPEDRYEDWVTRRREELQELSVCLLLELADIYEQRNEQAAAIRTLERLVASEAAHEEAHSRLMCLHARMGRRQQALRQYRQLREALGREQEAEPDTHTQRLYEAILAGRLPAEDGTASADVRLGPHEAEFRSEAAQPRHNLPAQLTSFVGREREVEDVTILLSGTRLLTLTGAGGCGKTRLALQVAADTVGAYPDGVWLADLAALADPRLVPRAVAKALGVGAPSPRSVTEALADALRRKRLLLMLDNCEHLLDACAQLAEALLRACPGLQILATSREPLGLVGETVWRVPSLGVPDPQHLPAVDVLAEFGAVRLFVERARASRPGFALTARNARAVARVCHRLDGIPLAIELAAMRLKALTVNELAARLDDILGLLVAGGRAGLPRHQTLRATLDWSFHLLGQPEQVLLRRLAVFAGGWMLEAAEAVCSDPSIPPPVVLEVLSQLVDKSLVVAGHQHGRTRYRLLEPIRQYATERLEEAREAAAVRALHAAWCLSLADTAQPELAGPDQGAWLERLDQEHDNFRAALSWSLEHDVTLALRLAASLWQFWERRGHFEEGARWLAALLPKAPERTSLRASILCGAGALARRAGRQKVAWSFLEQSLTVAREVGDTLAAASALQWLAFCADHDPACAVALCEESIRLFREVGETGLVWNGTGLAWSIAVLAVVLYRHGEPGRGGRLMEDGLRLARRAGHVRLIAAMLAHLSHVARHDGHYDRAQAFLEEAVRHYKAINSDWELGWAVAHLANLARLRGNRGEAIRQFGQAIALLGRLRSEFYLSQTLSWASVLAVEAGAHGTAARLAGAAAGLSTPENYVPDPDEAAEVEASLRATRDALGDTAFEREWFAGRGLTLEQSAEYASTVLPTLAGASSKRALRRTAGLTPREEEVADLLARGLTNREIASELVLAQKTVATHVSAILHKLGLTSRTQLPGKR